MPFCINYCANLIKALSVINAFLFSHDKVGEKRSAAHQRRVVNEEIFRICNFGINDVLELILLIPLFSI